MIQHDMILYDRFPVPDADIEYKASHDFEGQAIDLAEFVAGAMLRYGSIPAEVGDNMCCTDSRRFWDDTPSISVRENQRLAEIGHGSNPHWHKPTDRPDTYTEDDYEFGFNIVKMTAGAVAELVNAEPDCNMNDIGDDDDIAEGTSEDCNNNDIPDECDITHQTSEDCNGDGVPDECEPDCNTNGVPDECDITEGTSEDCNANGVPDECESQEDCNDNGIQDICDLNGDGRVDERDLSIMETCLTNTGAASQFCQVADLDGDGELTQRDWILFKDCYDSYTSSAALSDHR